MQPFPHHYAVRAHAAPQDDVELDADQLPKIASAPPSEFGGPGDRWSPETLLLAAVVDCFVLNFRAIAALSKFAWTSLDCDITGTVDRVDRAAQFTSIELRARLRAPAGAREDQAMRMLAKAEETCLVSNSLKVRPHLDATIELEA